MGLLQNTFYPSESLCRETLVLHRAGKWNPLSLVIEILHKKLTNNCVSLGQLLISIP